MRSYLELVRIPAVFTAPADVLAGVALAAVWGHAVKPLELILVVLASALIYCAGMAANDIFDRRVDEIERPSRPIPSGRVSLGAAWTFVAWGALHAGFLAIERLTDVHHRVGPWGGRLLTLAVVLLAWVMFRAENIEQATTIIGIMLGFGEPTHSALNAATFSIVPITLLGLLALRELSVILDFGWHRLSLINQNRWQPVALAALACAAVILRGPPAQFIYFQF